MDRWLHRRISSCPSRSELLVSNSKPKQSSNVGRKGRTAEIGKYQKPPSQPSAQKYGPGPKLISGRQVRQHRRPITQILCYPAMFTTVAFDTPHPDHYISSDPDTIQAPVIQIENKDGSHDHDDDDDDDDEIASSEFTPNFASHPSRFGWRWLTIRVSNCSINKAVAEGIKDLVSSEDRVPQIWRLVIIFRVKMHFPIFPIYPIVTSIWSWFHVYSQFDPWGSDCLHLPHLSRAGGSIYDSSSPAAETATATAAAKLDWHSRYCNTIRIQWA